jgi:hypothetical protein
MHSSDGSGGLCEHNAGVPLGMFLLTALQRKLGLDEDTVRGSKAIAQGMTVTAQGDAYERK